MVIDIWKNGRRWVEFLLSKDVNMSALCLYTKSNLCSPSVTHDNYIKAVLYTHGGKGIIRLYITPEF